MAANYYRIELRVPPEWSDELEKMQREVFEKYGKKVSKASLVREIVGDFLKKSSSSCIPNEKKT